MPDEKTIDDFVRVVTAEFDEVSLATIQRRFVLGYTAACRIIDALLALGVIKRREDTIFRYQVVKRTAEHVGWVHPGMLSQLTSDQPKASLSVFAHEPEGGDFVKVRLIVEAKAKGRESAE
jgi:hypothetical protein